MSRMSAPLLARLAACAGRGAWPALALGAALTITPAYAPAASFDCAQARSKLTRAICADAQLSRLDEQVWEAYGERIRTLTPAQYEQVRDRHITWRRQRGRFDRSIAALSEDYRQHLAWLTHPLLPLEGRYQRADGAEVNVEIDMRASVPALVAFGRSSALQWLPARAGVQGNPLVAEAPAGTPQPSLPWRGNALRVTPGFVGTPRLPIAACTFTLRWSAGVPVTRTETPAAAQSALADSATAPPVTSLSQFGDTLNLESAGSCGADFAGNYLLQGPAQPWPRHPYRTQRAPATPAPSGMPGPAVVNPPDTRNNGSASNNP
jgi:uncharacterized protein YecT (DUF1311 family)